MFENENTEITENFAVFGLQNPLHARLLKGLIRKQKGVIAAAVNYDSEKAVVRYNSGRTRNEIIMEKAKKLGVSLVIENEMTQDLINRRREYDLTAVKLKLLLSVILAVLFSLIMFFKLFDFATQYFVIAALILSAVYLIKFLEKRSKLLRKSNTVQIAKISKTAMIIRDDGKEELIDVESISEGDILLVNAGERISADGTIVSGTSLVDERILFDETNLAVVRFVGDKVCAETINLTNPITILVSAVGNKTEFAKKTRKTEEEMFG